jgi:hypothetical protein
MGLPLELAGPNARRLFRTDNRPVMQDCVKLRSDMRHFRGGKTAQMARSERGKVKPIRLVSLATECRRRAGFAVHH